jgi:hypothetical protein
MTVESPRFLLLNTETVYKIVRDITASIALGTYISFLDLIVTNPAYLGEPLKNYFMTGIGLTFITFYASAEVINHKINVMSS